MQRIFTSRSLLVCSLLGLALSQSGCKSQLDGKQAAKVQDAPAHKAPKPSEAPKAPAKAEAPAKAQAPAGSQLPLAKTSKVGFVGAKVTGDHTGAFASVSGHAKTSASALESLAIQVKTDSVSSDSAKLTAHLKSADFFDVQKFPTSTFESTKIVAKAGPEGATHEISGTLKLHGVSKLITFPAKVSASATGAKTAAQFKINRKDFGIVYPGRKDDLIKDEVLLKIDLSFGS